MNENDLESLRVRTHPLTSTFSRGDSKYNNVLILDRIIIYLQNFQEQKSK
jgi:hypothetical protein